jgi:ApbE superfamily uncharacterized protein (UPF0280 family)
VRSELLEQTLIAQRRDRTLANAAATAIGAEVRAGHRELALEQVAYVVDEQGARRRCPVVRGRVPAEHEQLLRSGNRRVQQIALCGECVLVLGEP